MIFIVFFDSWDLNIRYYKGIEKIRKNSRSFNNKELKTRLLGRDINTFNSQYGGLDVRYTTNVHDRYIIIDQNKIYHLGHSIKDLEKKIFQ